MWIDSQFYPHILDTILLFAPRSALIALRATSRQMCEWADALLGQHIIIVTHLDDEEPCCIHSTDTEGSWVTIEAPHGRLPIMYRLSATWKWAGALDGCRVLDLPDNTLRALKRPITLRMRHDNYYQDINPGRIQGSGNVSFIDMLSTVETYITFYNPNQSINWAGTYDYFAMNMLGMRQLIVAFPFSSGQLYPPPGPFLPQHPDDPWAFPSALDEVVYIFFPDQTGSFHLFSGDSSDDEFERSHLTGEELRDGSDVEGEDEGSHNDEWQGVAGVLSDLIAAAGLYLPRMRYTFVRLDTVPPRFIFPEWSDEHSPEEVVSAMRSSMIAACQDTTAMLDRWPWEICSLLSPTSWPAEDLDRADGKLTFLTLDEYRAKVGDEERFGLETRGTFSAGPSP